MGTHTRTDRAAGAVIAFEGLFLLVMAVSVGGFPVSVAGLLTLFVAVWLWRGGRGARVLAAALVAVAGLYSGAMLTGSGNVLWAVRITVFEPNSWLVRWPYFYWNPFVRTGVSGIPVESFPYGRFDDVAFWFPGIVAVGALLAACFLVAGWIAGRPRGVRSD